VDTATTMPSRVWVTVSPRSNSTTSITIETASTFAVHVHEAVLYGNASQWEWEPIEYFPFPLHFPEETRAPMPRVIPRRALAMPRRATMRTRLAPRPRRARSRYARKHVSGPMRPGTKGATR
jgi:hypothetical protein